MYSKVRNISNIDVSLVTIKYHSRNALNLEVATINRIVEMRLNLKDIPVPDKIHFHKQTREFIYSDLMEATIKLFKMQSTLSKIENQLKQEKVENKVHQ